MKRCPHCGGKYNIEIGVTYEEFRTADPLPPAEFKVYDRVNGGYRIHYCQKGVQVQ